MCNGIQDQLRDRAKAYGNVSQLADASGLDRANFCRWLRGNNVRTDTLERIASAVGFRIVLEEVVNVQDSLGCGSVTGCSPDR